VRGVYGERVYGYSTPSYSCCTHLDILTYYTHHLNTCGGKCLIGGRPLAQASVGEKDWPRHSCDPENSERGVW
jgi:hypothetical protein